LEWRGFNHFQLDSITHRLPFASSISIAEAMQLEKHANFDEI
jgi:hypothetical protein